MENATEQQPESVDMYIPTKRDELCYGYLPDVIPTDLFTDPAAGVTLLEIDDIAKIMTDMDDGFVGMRRSHIDRTEAVRQLILYSTLAKKVNNEIFFAVYRRGKGADKNLEGSLSLGMGGHVDHKDVVYHSSTLEQYQPSGVVEGVASSFWSTLSSGMREFQDEVALFKNGEEHEGEDNPVSLNIKVHGFISDYRPEQKGWVGNTHFCVLAVATVEDDVSFKMREEKYTTIGWMTIDELKERRDEFESWSNLAIGEIDAIVEGLDFKQG